MPQAPREQVFISYSHRDNRWLEDLQTMLKPLVRKQSISVWDDTKIKAGAKWKEQIEGALSMAKVAVLLVSPHFLASDFIAEHELPPILDAAAKEGLVILWVYVSSCLYEETEIAGYQAAHNIFKPLDYLSRAARAAVLVNVCRQIKAAYNASVGPSAIAPGTTGLKVALSNLPERNPFFTDRERVLAELQEVLAGQGRAALSGLGGVGKTQTAVEYGHRRLAEYLYCFWTSADSQKELVSGYVAIASLLKLPEADAQDEMFAVDAG